MAQRRMFSPDIVESDAFLEMPVSAQGLYFHLGMYADDDGFVSPRKIMRLLGSTEDDIKLLAAKHFVLPFENGVIVIKHWKMNNLVRKDWYRPTQYIEQKSQLYVKENGAYTLDSEQGIPLVNEPLTTRQRRLGKVSIGNTSVAVAPRLEIVEEEEDPKPKRVSTAKYPHSKIVFSWFPDYEKWWDMNSTQLKYGELTYVRGEKAVKSILAFLAKHSELDDCPEVITPYDLETKWKKIEKFAKRNGL